MPRAKRDVPKGSKLSGFQVLSERKLAPKLGHCHFRMKIISPLCSSYSLGNPARDWARKVASQTAGPSGAQESSLGCFFAVYSPTMSSYSNFSPFFSILSMKSWEKCNLLIGSSRAAPHLPPDSRTCMRSDHHGAYSDVLLACSSSFFMPSIPC